MKKEYNPNMTHQTTIYRRYQNAREGKNVYEELVKMAEGVKDLPIAPMDLASMIMDEVEDYEATWDMVYDEHLITGNVEICLPSLNRVICNLVVPATAHIWLASKIVRVSPFIEHAGAPSSSVSKIPPVPSAQQYCNTTVASSGTSQETPPASK